MIAATLTSFLLFHCLLCDVSQQNKRAPHRKDTTPEEEARLLSKSRDERVENRTFQSDVFIFRNATVCGHGLNNRIRCQVDGQKVLGQTALTDKKKHP